MPLLQEHQLRVAAVAKQVCDSLSVPIDTESVVKACLLHDMGNILKFELGKFPETIQPEGLEYWENVKAETIKKYGTANDHEATHRIAKELNVPQTVLDCMDSVAFERISENAKSNRYEYKICVYGDLRVGPYGVLSVNERLDDARKRYATRQDEQKIEVNRFDAIRTDTVKIEDQIFSKARIMPTDITDKSITPILEQLQTYEI